MALMKEIENPQGVIVPYWKIGVFNHNPVHKYVDMQFYGYISEAKKDEGKEPAHILKVRCIWDKYDKYFAPSILALVDNNPHTQGYLFAKENDANFLDAVDIL